MKVLLRLINKILDTTPRQWFYHFQGAALSFFYYFSKILKRFIDAEIIPLKFRDARLAMRLAIGFSICFHLAAFTALKLSKLPSITMQKENFIYDDTNVTLIEEEIASIKENSNYAIGIPNQKSASQQLLKRLNKGRRRLVLNERKRSLGNRSTQKLLQQLHMGKDGGVEKMSNLDQKLLATKLTNLKFKPDLKSIKVDNFVSSSVIRRAIAKHELQFKTCYEKALLSDENLAGQINFSIFTELKGKVSNSIIDFNGDGGSAGKAQLIQCLKNIAKGIQLPDTVNNAQINFKLLMI